MHAKSFFCHVCQRSKTYSSFYVENGSRKIAACKVCHKAMMRIRQKERRALIKRLNISFVEQKYLKKSMPGGPWFEQYKTGIRHER